MSNQAGKQAGRQAGKQTGRQAGRQAGQQEAQRRRHTREEHRDIDRILAPARYGLQCPPASCTSHNDTTGFPLWRDTAAATGAKDTLCPGNHPRVPYTGLHAPNCGYR